MPPPLTRKKSVVFNSFLLATAASVQHAAAKQRRNSDTEEILLGGEQEGGWLVYRWYSGGGKVEGRDIHGVGEGVDSSKTFDDKHYMDYNNKDLRDPLQDLSLYFPTKNIHKRSLLETS